MRITMGVSKRHAHLTKAVYKELFGIDELEVRNPINQPGEFASTSVIDVKWFDKIIERVRIVGPFRSYNQIELSRRDAASLEINPPVRKSGDVKNSHPIILCGPKKEVYLNEGAVIAQRHVHMDDEIANKHGFKDEEKVLIYKDGKELYDAHIKIQNPSYLELHIDDEEAEKFNLQQDDEVEVVRCGK